MAGRRVPPISPAPEVEPFHPCAVCSHITQADCAVQGCAAVIPLEALLPEGSTVGPYTPFGPGEAGEAPPAPIPTAGLKAALSYAHDRLHALEAERDRLIVEAHHHIAAEERALAPWRQRMADLDAFRDSVRVRELAYNAVINELGQFLNAQQEPPSPA
jgi:hypothetical protein